VPGEAVDRSLFFPFQRSSTFEADFGPLLEHSSSALSFIMLSGLLTVLALASSAFSHADHEHQTPISGPHKSLWYNTIPGDGGTQVGAYIPASVVRC
jgi:hypothetical protein